MHYTEWLGYIAGYSALAGAVLIGIAGVISFGLFIALLVGTHNI